MFRRGFLGLLSAGAVAAPKAVASLGTSVLDLPGIASAAVMAADYEDYSSGHTKEWAAKTLAKMAAKSIFDLDMERSETSSYSLTPDVASLRSVSLTHKMRMTRDQVFEKEQSNLKLRCQRILAGLED